MKLLVKWILRLTSIAFLAIMGFAAFFYFYGGVYNRPEMPRGAFSLYFDGGTHVIVVGTPDETSTRDYIFQAADISPFLKDAWSFCSQPTEGDRLAFQTKYPDSIERFDAICTLEIDGRSVLFGLVLSFPKV